MLLIGAGFNASGWYPHVAALARHHLVYAVGAEMTLIGYYWYEDPLPAHDIHGYQRLKQQLHIPVLATEVTPGGLEG